MIHGSGLRKFMMKMQNVGCFAIRKKLTRRQEYILLFLSFALPLLLWCLVSYVPFLYHPLVRVTDAGDSFLCAPGDLIERSAFEEENRELASSGGKIMRGERANPAYLPAPHQVARSLVTAFLTPPRRDGEAWFHESIGHSIRIVFLGFLISSLFGVPLGILCGTFPFFERLIEPFIEFFRYFPAPVFATLCVAILGINDAPKIAIIFIGTFFQQLPMVANTTRSADGALIEAAQTLGASRRRILMKVIIPSVLPRLYKDMRILLGWAWTYLIVAEVVGTSSGISWFINQQAKYRDFSNVYAAIIIIGCIGLFCDMFLAWFGRQIFPWESKHKGIFYRAMEEIFGPRDQVFSIVLSQEERRKRDEQHSA